MGRGVYTYPDAEIVIVDHEQVYGKFNSETQEFEHIECELDFQPCFDEFCEAIRSLCPKSFRNVSEFPRDQREGLLIAQNDHFQIRVVDWECDFYVVHEPRPDLEGSQQGLAEALNEPRSHKLFEKMSEHWALRVRTSAWTTGRWCPREAA